MTKDGGRTGHAEAVSLQGHYAGPVSRLAAFALDQSVVVFSFSVLTAVATWVVSLVTDGRIQLHGTGVVVTAGIFVLWNAVYYAYPWSVSGKSFGMALLGIRVVTAQGGPCGLRAATVRILTLPLGFVTMGIGFLPIVFGRQRRGIHDAIAGTAVVYSWDARAARWRFLAREADTPVTVGGSN